jgi:hypothetical protein
MHQDMRRGEIRRRHRQALGKLPVAPAFGAMTHGAILGEQRRTARDRRCRKPGRRRRSNMRQLANKNTHEETQRRKQKFFASFLQKIRFFFFEKKKQKTFMS